MTAFTGRVKFLFALLTVLIVSSCSSGESFSGSCEECGAFRMQVNWQDRFTLKNRGKYLPTAADSITVNITGKRITTPITAEISYPNTGIVIDEIPKGWNIAEIKAFDEGTVLSQKKASFEIIKDQTTDSGEISLGVAITQISTDIAFEPSSIDIPYGASLPFQNWTRNSYNCSVDLKGTSNNLNLVGIYQEASGQWIFPEDSILMNGWRTCEYSLVEAPSVTGQATLALPPVVQSYETRILDYFPKNANGQYDITLQARDRTGGTYYDMDYMNDYRFAYTPHIYDVPAVNITDFEAEDMFAHPENTKDAIIKVTLNGDYGQIVINGTTRMTGAGSARFYIYKGAANWNSPLWQANNDSTINALQVNYTNGEELFFGTDSLGNDMSDWAVWRGMHIQGVQQ